MQCIPYWWYPKRCNCIFIRGPQIIFACSSRLWFLHLRFSNWITMIRTIVWLILWHIRGLKYHQDIFNIRKQSLLHYPSHPAKKMTDSQQTVYTKMMIEGLSKLFKQPPYRICDDTRCFTKNLNHSNSIHRKKKKL